MKKLKEIKIGEISFYKTSLSERNRHCVGVAFHEGLVKIINTNEQKDILNFTIDEWKTFIKGIKKGDFDNLIG